MARAGGCNGWSVTRRLWRVGFLFHRCRICSPRDASVRPLAGPRIHHGRTFGIRGREVLFSTAGFHHVNYQTTYDVTADDQRFVFVRPTEASGAGNLILVENFFEELKAKVGN